MKTYAKSHKLDYVSYDVRGPVLKEAARMEARGDRILKLNIGNPAPFGLMAPVEIIEDMISNLPAAEGYSDSKGLFSARKAIMQYHQLKGLPNLDINHIYTGNGASEMISMCMQGLLDDGDEILVPSPDYPLWTACVTLSGGKAVHYVCDEQADWFPDVNDIRAKVTDRTKGIVIINPNNPTGALYSNELLQEIVEVAREHDLIIFADEIYDRLVMDGLTHTSIASLAPDVCCVTLNGLSKSHRIAGFRVGWMAISGRKDHVQGYIEGLDMLASMRLCSNVPAQMIVQTALGGTQSANELLIPGGRLYEQREVVDKMVNEIPGLTQVRPKAAFYTFPHIDTKRFNITDDEKFCIDLLHEKKVLLVPGKGFHWEAPDHFRIVYLPRVDVLKEAIGALGEFLDGYQQHA